MKTINLANLGGNSLKSWALFFLVVTIVLRFVPFNPQMPDGGLDPSWQIGMNQALVQGFIFGRDISFTFGPYASMYTFSYHPATDGIMLAGTMYMGCIYAFAIVALMREIRWYLLVLFAVAFVALTGLNDALYLSYVAIAVLCGYKFLINNKNNLNAVLLAVIFFTPFGLLPLIKGTFLIFCIASIALIFILLVSYKKWVVACTVVVVPLISLLFFWKLAGQRLADLPIYFTSMIPIVTGYTEAMSIRNVIREIIFYLIGAFFILWSIYRAKNIEIKEKIFLGCFFFVYLFLAFKAGFVRHDGHAVIAGFTLFLASIFLFVLLKKNWSLSIFCLLIAVHTEGHYTKPLIEKTVTRIKSIYVDNPKALIHRMSDADWLPNKYLESIATLKKEAPFPKLQGTSDIYSHNQADLIASGNVWNPRPIFQSYSAYTAALANANKNHLIGDSAPDNIFFNLQAIDSRFPTLEDGVSWPELIKNYSPQDITNGFLLLRKNNLRINSEPQFIRQEHTSMGKLVMIPFDTSPIFIETKIEKSFLGKIVNIFFKPSSLEIRINLRNGEVKVFRMIASMGNTGFVISPLIETIEEFLDLYKVDAASERQNVESFVISPVNNKWQWKTQYEVTFKKM